MSDQGKYSDPEQFLEPDDIIVPEQEQEAKQNRFEELSALGKIYLPWKIRLITALAGLTLLLVGAATLVTWAIAVLADAVSMHKVTLFILWRRCFWCCAKHALGVGVGVLIAAVNPPLGFGTVVLYLAYQEGEDLQKGKFFQSVREYLRRFENRGSR